MTDIVSPATINDLPPGPQLTDTPSDFNAKAFATVAAFPAFIDQANAVSFSAHTNAVAANELADSAQNSAAIAIAARDLAQAAAATAIVAPGTGSTSTTSLILGPGAKYIATQPGKSWVAGQSVVIARTDNPVGFRMFGVVLSYDSGSGAFIVDVPNVASEYVGSGSFSVWSISLTAPRTNLAPLASPVFTGAPTAPTALASDVGERLATTEWAARHLLLNLPAGVCAMHAGNTAPSGWLKRNGAAISRTTYSRLYEAIGTTYGAGDGSTTFNLPDDRAMFDRGWDDGRGIDPGRAFGSYQLSQNLLHAHGITDVGHGHGLQDLGHAHTASTNSTGSHTHQSGWEKSSTYAGASNPTAGLANGGTFGGLAALRGAAAADTTEAGGAHSHTVTVNSSGTGINVINNGTGIIVQGDGGNESRPRNGAKLPIIKY